MENKKKKSLNLPNLSSSLKLRIFSVLCLFIHISIAFFSIYNSIMPMFYFNIGSISIYIICMFLIKNHLSMIFYIGYIEIILHSFVSVILIGNNFGFSIYFIAMVPMSYHLLYTTKAKYYIRKASILSFISFFMYALCYIISNIEAPIYNKESLTQQRPYIYIINMFIAFTALTLFSILFLIETENAYRHLVDKNRELDNLASTDPLTGLHNRRTMTEHVKHMYDDYRITNKPFSLIICDIDNFKLFNDTYGHDCGDEVLKTIATNLKSLTREHDFLCRWGGEEFLVFLSCADRESAQAIAERIRLSISQTDIKFNDYKLRITMTFGVSCSSETDNYSDLFKLADKRLYQGKNSGKNKVV